MDNIITTNILLDNSGREYDSGRAYYRAADLRVLTKDEAIDAFKSGKRVYFIYKNNRIYRTNCRKVCNDLDYLKDHYDCYREVCGVLVKTKEV